MLLLFVKILISLCIFHLLLSSSYYKSCNSNHYILVICSVLYFWSVKFICSFFWCSHCFLFLYFVTTENGQTRFKNLPAFAARFWNCVWPFWNVKCILDSFKQGAIQLNHDIFKTKWLLDWYSLVHFTIPFFFLTFHFLKNYSVNLLCLWNN